MSASSAAAPRAAHLNPHSPYVYDVRVLGRRAGAMREDVRTVPAPQGLGSEVIGVPAGAPVTLDVRLESVTEGVLVTGTLTAPVEGECARCLDPISDEIRVDLQELFAWPDSVTDETTEADEVHRIEAEHLDMAPVIRDAVVLALPWTPVCSDDCAGLCATCGERLDELPDDHTHEVLDPRWAALRSVAAADGPSDPSHESSERPASHRVTDHRTTDHRTTDHRTTDQGA